MAWDNNGTLGPSEAYTVLSVHTHLHICSLLLQSIRLSYIPVMRPACHWFSHSPRTPPPIPQSVHVSPTLYGC